MKFLRFSIRELVLLVVIAALALAWAREHRRAEGLSLALATERQGVLALTSTAGRAQQQVAWLNERLRECVKNLSRAKLGQQAGESAGPR
jgi:hypothetical protein